MNVFQCKITGIQSKGNLSLVQLKLLDYSLTAIVIDTPDNASYLKMNKEVKVIFKETEVIIGRGEAFRISLQNRIPGKVKRIEKGDLLSRVVIDSEAGEIVSVITTNAVRQLELEDGIEVMAMVKTNEIMLSE